MKMIVGLGNPGDQYARTRHNIGYLLLDAIDARLGLDWQTSKKLNARFTKHGDRLYVKPLTFMNESGRAVRSVLDYFKLLPKTMGVYLPRDANLADMLTVVHDDLDIAFGTFKISLDSRSAGHRGVQSVIDQLKTKNFRRLRIGIKTAAAVNFPADKYVLQPFNPEEFKILDALLQQLAGDTTSL